MFGLKKEKAESKNFLNEADFQAENIPIHTMARDLESFSQMEEPSVNSLPEPEETPAPEIEIKRPVEQAGASPFLPNREVSEAPSAPAPRPKIESFVKPISTSFLPEKETAMPEPVQEIMADSEIPAQEEVAGQDNDQKKKIVLILIIVLLIIFFSAGGYYYWSTRSASQVQPENPPVQETENNQKPATNEKQAPAVSDNPAPAKFSQTERNYFMLDLGDASNASFKQMVQNYFNEISDSKISFPVEFTIIDTGNSPVDFRTFMRQVGIKFSPELMSALNDNFIFYIYNDQGSPGVGLALSVKGQLNPEEILLREEANLAMELQPLFPVSQSTIVQKGIFSTGEYDSARWGKIGIRFQNITNPGSLSVDYSFVNIGKDMLFIGTTKNTLRAIVDNINPGIGGR